MSAGAATGSRMLISGGSSTASVRVLPHAFISFGQVQYGCSVAFQDAQVGRRANGGYCFMPLSPSCRIRGRNSRCADCNSSLLPLLLAVCIRSLFKCGNQVLYLGQKFSTLAQSVNWSTLVLGKSISQLEFIVVLFLWGFLAFPKSAHIEDQLLLWVRAL